jgi:GT2 family glycosyltransferase
MYRFDPPDDNSGLVSRDTGRFLSRGYNKVLTPKEGNMSPIGVVVIGRNEGERLRVCLQALDTATRPVVYVDSGSTDESIALARSSGAHVVELDPSTPFTAGRARNAGLARLLEVAGDIRFVQFVDGDTELAPGWLESGAKALEADTTVGVVCGRLRERQPERSVYNRLCDLEWDTPVGERKACGGNALMRAEAVRCVGGFDPTVPAAEDDEICLRIRRAGWRVLRLDADMGRHDAAMMHFRQWWRRAVRCGYAYAQGAWLHGRGPERHFVRERRRVLFWGAALPVLILGLAWPTGGWSLLALLLYPIQALRVMLRERKRSEHGGAVAAYGAACMLGKFPEFIGICRFYQTRLWRQTARLVEHK